MSEESKEFRDKYRPKNFNDVVGQKEAKRMLAEMGKQGAIPHALLFTGPSGCGKTTLARILSAKLKCFSHDLQEINAAADRGIDAVRGMISQKGSAPLGSACRVWILDEAHSLTSEAQDALLKLLEDVPSHAYFMLATTDPQKLKKTIITRCTEIKCTRVDEDDLKLLIQRVLEAEKLTLSTAVINRIVDSSDASPRKCLVILQAVVYLKDQNEQLAAISKADTKSQGIELARLLIKKANWSEVSNLLRGLEDDPEGIRRLVLSYCSSILKGGNGPVGQAALIMEEFRETFFYTGEPGLVLACYNSVRS